MKKKEKTAGTIGQVLSWALACLLAWGLAVFVAIGGAHAGEAGALCTDRKGAGEKLASQYSEARVNLGLATNGSVIEVFSTDNGSTFTILITTPRGTSCIVATGENWEQVPFKLKKGISYGNPL